MHTARYTLLQGRLLVAPVPQDEHALVPKSRGLIALTQRTGTDLARLLDAKGTLAELLTRRFADRPVALPLTSRGGYAELLSMLESTVVDDAKHHVSVSSPPAQQLRLSLGSE